MSHFRRASFCRHLYQVCELRPVGSTVERPLADSKVRRGCCYILFAAVLPIGECDNNTRNTEKKRKKKENLMRSDFSVGGTRKGWCRSSSYGSCSAQGLQTRSAARRRCVRKRKSQIWHNRGLFCSSPIDSCAQQQRPLSPIQKREQGD